MLEDPSSYINVSESAKDTDVVNPTHAYYNGSRTSQDKEDPSWSTSIKTRRQRRHLQLWKRLGCHFILLYLYLLGTLFYTSAGNTVKEILLKLNLPDHRKLKDGGEVKEFQRSFRHSDTERLSQSDEVLKLKNFKKDATLKLSKSTNQEWYEHVGPEVTSYTRWQDSLR
ncbi:hypothetical protein Tco_1405739 [Tanacetum coccineum]